MMHPTIFETQAPDADVVTQSLRNTRLSCFWIDDIAATAQRYPALAGATRTDDLVVGGGYAGLWTAIKLKTLHPERRVTLIEAKQVGWAASGRNGGFCEASITHGEANARSRWPDEAELLHNMGLENLDAIEQFISEHDLDVDFERTGQLTVANEEYQLAELSETSQHVIRLDQAEVTQRIHSPTFLGGEFAPRENANVHPAKLAAELARYAHSIGVEIAEQTRATHLSKTQSGQLVCLTPLGPINAERVALCTNVFPSLLKRYRFHTVPVYDYVLMTEPLTQQQLDSIGWHGREGLADMANQFHYSRLTADNRVLWGGYDAVYHPGAKIRSAYEDNISSHRKLASHFFTTFPQLSDVSFSHRWAGVIDTSTRFCAFFGEGYAGKVQYVAGFTGLGVGATHFAADVIVDRLEGRKTARTQLQMVQQTPLPFPPEPLASIGIQATRWSLNRADHHHGKRNLLLKTLDALGLGFDS